jgi:hypothetical protein
MAHSPGAITMLERISFQLANNRARYTHFIHGTGDIACLKELSQLCEARVGLLVESGFPSEAQYAAVRLLARYAVGENPRVVMTFDDSTAPFRPSFPPDHVAEEYADVASE